MDGNQWRAREEHRQIIHAILAQAVADGDAQRYTAASHRLLVLLGVAPGPTRA